MTQFSITMTDEERRAAIHGLKIFMDAMLNAKVQIEDKPHAETAKGPEPPADRPRPTPIEPVDRWARNPQGAATPHPEGCVEHKLVTVWKTEQRKPRNDPSGAPFLKVTWAVPGGNGYIDANCFDTQLWPWIEKVKAENQRTTLYVKQSGKYLNLVGIRA